MTESDSRYRGKPLLRLLESYVLSAIGQLPEKNARILKEITPNLRSLYRADGDWEQIISKIMELPPNMPALIRENWAKNTDIAKKNGLILSPQQFAEMFTDENFVRKE